MKLENSNYSERFLSVRPLTSKQGSDTFLGTSLVHKYISGDILVTIIYLAKKMVKCLIPQDTIESKKTPFLTDI